MPFEVYPVQGITNGSVLSGSDGRSARDVADEIKYVYEQVAEKGGEVVGSHEIEGAGVKKSLTNFLYIVAKLPEA